MTHLRAPTGASERRGRARGSRRPRLMSRRPSGVLVLPFVIVVVNLSLPAPDELVPIVAAFLASSIAGWIAIVAPAGFGVREAVFVFAHPSRAMVQEGLGWIVLHRALFTLFDLLFGVAAIIVICLRNRVSGR